MIGGPPIAYPQQFAVQPPQFPTQPRLPSRPPVVPANAGVQPSQPAMASLPPPRTVRGQADDEPVESRPLVLPTPEQLGIAVPTTTASPIDWTAIHRRLDQMGATCFQLERPVGGGCRVTCLLPTGQANHSRRLEAQANTQAEAVRLVLDQAEEWAKRK